MQPVWFNGLEFRLQKHKAWVRFPTVSELFTWTCAGVLAQARIPCLCQGQRGSFSAQIRTANNETVAEIGTAQALFNGQRMEKSELNWPINFSTRFGQRHLVYRRFEVKGRELEREA